MSLSQFASPWWLLFLAVVVALAAGYVVIQRRRQKHVLRFANMELLEKVAPNRPNITRHLPTALLLVGLVFLTVALAGPTADKRVPRNRATVVLVIDVSLSMKATDVEPSRLAAAQEAAKSFADGLTPGINLGLVAFAGTASVLVSPTPNRDETKAAIDNLTLSERTATVRRSSRRCSRSTPSRRYSAAASRRRPPGSCCCRTVSRRSRRAPTTRAAVFTAARQAKDKGVPISTISFGTGYGTVEIEGDRIPVPVDDPSLREIANLSGGNFFTASSLEELRDVYDTLEEQIGFENARGDASRPWLVSVCCSAPRGWPPR